MNVVPAASFNVSPQAAVEIAPCRFDDTVVTFPFDGDPLRSVYTQAVGRLAGPSINPNDGVSFGPQYVFSAVGTVKATPLLAEPPTVTITFPVVAPLGTGATIEAELQLVGAASVPLKVTVLVP